MDHAITTTTTTEQDTGLTLAGILAIQRELKPPPNPFDGIGRYAASKWAPAGKFLIVPESLGGPVYVLCNEADVPELLSLNPYMVRIGPVILEVEGESL